MQRRAVHLYLRFLVCLSFIFNLPACISRITLEHARAINPGADVIEVCVRPPTVEDDAGLWAHRRADHATMSNRDPAFEGFVATADYIYQYDPNAPPEGSSLRKMVKPWTWPKRGAASLPRGTWRATGGVRNTRNNALPIISLTVRPDESPPHRQTRGPQIHFEIHDITPLVHTSR